EANLLEVVRTADSRRCGVDLLDGGQEQPAQHGDDRYHHQQLDQRERARRSMPLSLLKHSYPSIFENLHTNSQTSPRSGLRMQGMRHCEGTRNPYAGQPREERAEWPVWAGNCRVKPNRTI